MRKRNAFTLVEVLVVITIVSVLAFLAVSSYGSARRQAKIDIVTDTIVSVLRQQQSLAMSGKTGRGLPVSMSGGALGGTRQNVPTCYGIYFKTDTAPYVRLVEAPYVSVNISIDPNRSDFCDMRDGFYKLTDFAEMENFKVSEILAFGNSIGSSEGFAVVFRPPVGRLSLGSLDNLQPLQSVNDSTVHVKIASANDDSVTGFVFDVSTGLAERELLGQINN